MATGKIVVNVVDVGQGQCTFVEIWDDDGMAPELIETLLFDCGSVSRKTNNIVLGNLDYIASRVSQMTHPKLNAIFFSHSDADHINLTKKLLDKIKDLIAPNDLTVGEVWYGGKYSNYKKKKEHILKYIKTEFKAKLIFPPEDSSNLNAKDGSLTNSLQIDSTKYPQLWENSDKKVLVYLLVGNVLKDDPDGKSGSSPKKKKKTEDPEIKNRVSLVLLLRFSDKDYIIAGDATNRSMALVNFYAESAVLNHTIMVTIPHHGSRSTAFEYPTTKDHDTDTVSTFAKLLKGKTVTVSAHKQHNHPSLEVIGLFTPSALQTPVVKDRKLKDNSHYIVAYIDRKLEKPGSTTGKVKAAYTTFATESNVYTTLCFYKNKTPTFALPAIENTVTNASDPVATIPAAPSPAFNQFACWVYTTQSDGTTTLFGASSLPADGASPNPNIFTKPATGNLAAKALSSNSIAEQRQVAPTKPFKFIATASKPPAKTLARHTPGKMRHFK
jgi:hypothetical protein